MKAVWLFFLSCLIFSQVTFASDDHYSIEYKIKDGKWRSGPARTMDHLEGFERGQVNLSIYGGDASRRFKGSGFFRVEKIGGQWWLIDPLGHPFYSVGCNSVRINPTARGTAALKKKFGTAKGWAEQTSRQLSDMGFNTVGSWSDHDLLNKAGIRLPYTVSLSLSSGYKTKEVLHIFDPGFEEAARRKAKELISKYREDPWLIGYFSDNELPLRFESLDNFLGLPRDGASYQAAVKWCEKNNVDYKAGKFDDKERTAFSAYVAERYFKIAERIIREFDADHLYLGSRFHGPVLSSSGKGRGVIEACGKYADVISANIYGQWTPGLERMGQWSAWASGKPLLLTEWYAKGQDSGMPNTSGAGFTVHTQKERGYFYQHFVLEALKSANIVGVHWFKYIDNDITDTEADLTNIDSNKGFVNAEYEPYQGLAGAMKELNEQIYPLIEFQRSSAGK